MTEQEWLSSNDPGQMLTEVQGRISDRKLRLFAVACCRHVWHLLTDEGSRKAVAVAEPYADGKAEKRKVGRCFDTAPAKADSCESYGIIDMAWMSCTLYSRNADIACFFGNGHPAEMDAPCADLVREIVGNPFHPVTLPCAEYLRHDGIEIRSTPVLSRHRFEFPHVIAMAEAAYENRLGDNGHLDHVRLMILADALEEAGCEDREILRHLRSSAPHVRGCWALDLLLGRE